MNDLPFLKPGWQDRFLAALREVPVVTWAAEQAGISRMNTYHYAKKHPEFAEAWKDAMEAGYDRAEAEAFRRAVPGFEEPVIYQGNLTFRQRRVVTMNSDGEEVVSWQPVLDSDGQPVPLTIRKHSDTILLRILGAKKAEYRTERTELTGANGEPLGGAGMDSTARAARVAALMQLAAARKAIEDLA